MALRSSTSSRCCNPPPSRHRGRANRVSAAIFGAPPDQRLFSQRGTRSPPSQVRPSWLRRAVAALVAPEPTDLAGRLTVAATVVANLPSVVSALLGESGLGALQQFFHLWNQLEWSLSAVILAGGFMSRSRTARALAAITTAGLAGLFLADSLGVSGAVFATGRWIYHASLASAVGLWAARALRRRLTRNET
jgi:hypothetical protein